METKRLAIAIALTALLLLIWPRVFPPPEPPPGLSPTTSAPIQRSDAPALETRPELREPSVPAEPAAVAADATVADLEEELVVRNGVFEVRLTNRGGRATSWRPRCCPRSAPTSG